MKPVIICGGVGTKMWPESRIKTPKQFLPLFNGKSMFELNWETLRKQYKPEEIFLQTNACQAEIAKKLVPEIVKENVFEETEMRNHGPATGFAAAMLKMRGFGDEPFMLIQADILHMDEDLFLKSISMAGEMAVKENVYITGSMVPTQIVEGVDYLVKGELLREENGIKLYRVADYIDRTDSEKIKTMMGSSDLLLHWNHTTMTPNNLLAMYQKYRPDWSTPLQKIIDGGDIASNYATMPKGPIEDITAKVHRDGGSVVMVFPFEIWDFGTWKSIENYEKEQNINSDDNQKIEIDSHDNYVRAKKVVALIGVEDLVVVDTPDAILICKKDKTGKVGEIVEKLKTDGKDSLI